MDVQFMEEFYQKQYEDAVYEICEGDSDFLKLRQEVGKDIEAMEARLKGLGKEASTQTEDTISGWIEQIGEELTKLYHKTLDDMGDKYYYIIRKTYLQGAMDRERMLR